MNYKELFFKYKHKKEFLENKIGGNNDLIYYKNNLDPDDKKYNFYMKQSIYSYWIASSHNTEMIYGQIFDPSSVCYYKILLSIFFGGCLEIDVFGTNAENNDILIAHTKFNSSKILLSELFKLANDTIEHKKKHNIVSGPIIFTIDNKTMTTEQDIKLFWDCLIIAQSKYPNLIKEIDDKYDLTVIPLDTLSNNVFIRWGDNLKGNKVHNKYVHLKKVSVDLTKNIQSDVKNLTYSMSSPNIDSNYKINQYIILNTMRNIIRIYPNPMNTKSGNYDTNIQYLKNGIQMAAINIQTDGFAKLFNNSVFLPSDGKPCTPSEVFNNLDDACKKGWKKSSIFPLGYRLKPIWLLGLLPHPGLYNLTINFLNISNAEYNDINVHRGDMIKNIKTKIGENIILNDVDVSIPFLIFEANKLANAYRSGIEIPWDIRELSGTLSINLHKLNLKGTYNPVEIVGNEKDCDNNVIYDIKKVITMTIEYKWEKSKTSYLYEYNFAINNLRKSPQFKKYTTDAFLNDLKIMSEYQSQLSALLAGS